LTESNTWKQTNRANPLLVTGAAVGAIGRTVTEKLLKQGKAVRAMVRNEDERAQALREMGAEVVDGNLLDLDSMHMGYRERKGKDDKLGEKIATGGGLSTGGGFCQQ
jgi:nucleoside-diphosphate-sugar epimerase